MPELKIQSTNDSQILKRISVIATRMAMGASLAAEATGFVVTSKAVNSPSAAISIESVSPGPSVLASASSEVKTFVESNKIALDVKLAERMANQLFPIGSCVSLCLENDPEINDSWIGVRVTTTGDTQNLLNIIKRFSAEWVSRVSGARRYLVRLSLDVV